MSPGTFYNWARNHRAHPRTIRSVRGDAALAALVERARARGETVKPVGAGHSWTDIACTDGHLIDLDGDDDILDVDITRCTVTVRAGIRLHKLVQTLDLHGLALCNLGSITEQSVAGAISTGTHGSGARFGNLATQVTGLRLVTGTGEILDVSATREPEIFSAARVGLGCLGVITQVTLQCERAFCLHERSEPMRFDAAMSTMQDVVSAHEHVKLWWLPHTNTVHVFRQDRTDASPTRGADLQHRIGQHGAVIELLRGVLWAGQRQPRAIPVLNRFVKPLFLRPTDRVDHGYRLFSTLMPPRHLEMEYAIPRHATRDAVERVRALIRRERLRVNFIQELRFVAADDILLSPAYGRETCHFGAYIGDTRDRARYFERFEQIMLDLDGRPHWGKCFSIGHAELRERLPNYERFSTIRAKLDPDGVFVNPFVRRVFGL